MGIHLRLDIGIHLWIQETWVDLSIVDYPYASNFLEPLPAWPVKVLVYVFCK
jgi:lysosomal Pro-X carboxypeptidase